ncbi:hypothetical protein HK098_007495 [Nowakowskiella sp. JEL0407]|nr:hypothetical protein HK098_007495 [Nowakowskiella sp. JEL0407]
METSDAPPKLPEFTDASLCPYDFLVSIYFVTNCDESYENRNPSKISKDQAEVIQLSYAVLSTSQNRVVHRHKCFVKPEKNVGLPAFVTEKTGISDEDLDSTDIYIDSLSSALSGLHDFILTNLIKNDKSFCLVTHGDYDLRYLLPLQAKSKDFELEPYFSIFYDVITEVSLFLSAESRKPPLKTDLSSLGTALGVSVFENGNGLSSGDGAVAIAKITESVLLRTNQRNGGKKVGVRAPFSRPLDLRLIEKEFFERGGRVVHLSALPFMAVKSEIEALVGVAGVKATELWVGKNSEKRPNGTGYAVFAAHDDAKACLGLHGTRFGERTVLVSPFSMELLDGIRERIGVFPEVVEVYEPTAPETKSSDWMCPSCQYHNFSTRRTCMKCGTVNPTNSGPTNANGQPLMGNGTSGIYGNVMRPGDWICPNTKCAFQNFASRFECFKCHGPRPTGRGSGDLHEANNYHRNGGVGIPSSSSRILPGDWTCSQCNVNNFASRTRCVQCGAPDTLSTRYVGVMAGTNGSMQRNAARARPTDRPGDWNCGNENCRYHNYASRTECYRCGSRKPPQHGPPIPGGPAWYPGAAGLGGATSGSGMKPGDWKCGVCQFHNFAKRETCAACGSHSKLGFPPVAMYQGMYPPPPPPPAPHQQFAGAPVVCSTSAFVPQLSLFRLYSAGPAPLTIQQIEDRILNVLKDFEKVDSKKLKLDAHFIHDLGLDSLDQVEVTMALEDEFNIEIPDREAEEIFTIRQAVEKV